MPLKRALIAVSVMLLQTVVACDASAARKGNRTGGSGVSHGTHAGSGPRWHGGHRLYRSSIFVGLPWFAPLYWYPPVPYSPLAVPIELEQYATPLPAGYWYYCHSAGAYYPGVTQCAEGWEPVAPQ